MIRKDVHLVLPLDHLIYGKYIRYEFLQTLVGIEFAGSSAEHINVFIDLNDVLMPLYTSQITKDAVEIIASCILNMVSHYRTYFWTRHRVVTQIVFIYSDITSPDILRFCPEYNALYRNRMNNGHVMHDRILAAMERVALLVPYMPDVYLKCGNVEPAVMINYLAKQPQFVDIINVVISGSEYMYALPGQCKNTVVFRNKVTSNGKTALSYNGFNAINAFIYETRKSVIEEVIYPPLITAIMALSGLPKRMVNSTKDISSTLRLVKQIPVDIIGDPKAMYQCMMNISSKKKTQLLSYEDWYNRYMALDLNLQTMMYANTPQAADASFLTNLDDPESVKYINGTYFKKYPINFEGV